SSWKKLLQKFAISPVQQFAYTVGKNSADSALIIDAMDLLYSGKLDGFCIVSSDSDFTGLANRIREEGLLVLGFGEKKTPEAFRMACKKFIFTEVLRPEKVQDKSAEKVKSKVISAQNNDEVKKQKQAFPTKIIQEALDKSADDSGWAYLGAFGSILNRLLPEFDARNYGFQKLSDMVKGRSNLFEIEERSLSGSNSKQIYVRLKSKKD
ncbi:MAG: NYN domain-containing protein, partial [Fibrobacter sp.]|nr:NYN domain-containing protein [Fibrobacter sp.]